MNRLILNQITKQFQFIDLHINVANCPVVAFDLNLPTCGEDALAEVKRRFE